jgi:DinB superfamily
MAGRDPLEVTRATPARLEKLLESSAPAKLTVTPAPGKWSVRDILCHLADCEVVFAFRLRQALAEDHHVIQPFDQDNWAVTYNHYDASMALATFSAVRQWNLAMIAGLKATDFSKPLNHPERGDMTLQVVVETMAGHDLNHLRQVEAILA